MSVWNQVIGHKQQQEMLRIAATKTRLAHAFLFVGSEGIGKHRFAKTFAQTLLCEKTEEHELQACGECHGCKQVQANTHPDLLSVNLPEGKMEIPIDLIAGAGDRRGKEGLLHELSLRPMAGERRIAILDQSEKLNIASANALLKTLEEPPDNAIIILITSDLERMLDTIRSRCQSLFFGDLSTEEIRTILSKIEQEDDTLPPIDSIPESLLRSGSLNAVFHYSNIEIRNLQEAVENQFKNKFIHPATAREQLAAIMDELGGDTKQQRKYAGMTIHFGIEYWSRRLKEVAQTPEQFPLELEMETALLDRLLAAQEELSRNVSVPLCLDSLWNDLARIQKRELVR